MVSAISVICDEGSSIISVGISLIQTVSFLFKVDLNVIDHNH